MHLIYPHLKLSTMNEAKSDKLEHFFIQTHGCQMNYHDSERMQGMLENIGMSAVNTPDTADLLIINTCAVREKPERKLYGALNKIKSLKEIRPEIIVAVTGCMAPRDADTIRQRAPFVDLLIGPRSIHRLPKLIAEVRNNRTPLEYIALSDDPTPMTPIRRSGMISAWVDVIYGCSYNCSFCAVPSARGKEASRLPADIFAEIDELTAMGYKEITLLGQTVNAYGRDWHYKLNKVNGNLVDSRIDFAWLLTEIDKRYPEMRVRFTSPHPQLFNPRLIETIAKLPTVCEHMHFPLQSADNEVLRRMRRTYTYEKYKSIVESLRDLVPDIAITTDIIVGFPGETEEQFETTLEAVRTMEFDQAFMFAYSPRRHTTAAEFTDMIHPDEQKRRLHKLIEVANIGFSAINSRQVGRVFEVLVEGPSPKNPDKYSGRTRSNKTTIFDASPEMVGKLIQVEATTSKVWGFYGKLVDNNIKNPKVRIAEYS